MYGPMKVQSVGDDEVDCPDIFAASAASSPTSARNRNKARRMCVRRECDGRFTKAKSGEVVEKVHSVEQHTRKNCRRPAIKRLESGQLVGAMGSHHNERQV
mmetsp:Transcript_127126/g.406727  ORF Transcript_127126/g.406727 Transcript_127126/m.406727 type:complete len:101 (+) Transcript_127126:402-704(+)